MQRLLGLVFSLLLVSFSLYSCKTASHRKGASVGKEQSAAAEGLGLFASAPLSVTELPQPLFDANVARSSDGRNVILLRLAPTQKKPASTYLEVSTCRENEKCTESEKGWKPLYGRELLPIEGATKQRVALRYCTSNPKLSFLNCGLRAEKLLVVRGLSNTAAVKAAFAKEQALWKEKDEACRQAYGELLLYNRSGQPENEGTRIGEDLGRETYCEVATKGTDKSVVAWKGTAIAASLAALAAAGAVLYLQQQRVASLEVLEQELALRQGAQGQAQSELDSLREQKAKLEQELKDAEKELETRKAEFEAKQGLDEMKRWIESEVNTVPPSSRLSGADTAKLRDFAAQIKKYEELKITWETDQSLRVQGAATLFQQAQIARQLAERTDAIDKAKKEASALRKENEAAFAKIAEAKKKWEAAATQTQGAKQRYADSIVRLLKQDQLLPSKPEGWLAWARSGLTRFVYGPNTSSEVQLGSTTLEGKQLTTILVDGFPIGYLEAESDKFVIDPTLKVHVDDAQLQRINTHKEVVRMRGEFGNAFVDENTARENLETKEKTLKLEIDEKTKKIGVSDELAQASLVEEKKLKAELENLQRFAESQKGLDEELRRIEVEGGLEAQELEEWKQKNPGEKLDAVLEKLRAQALTEVQSLAEKLPQSDPSSVVTEKEKKVTDLAGQLESKHTSMENAKKGVEEANTNKSTYEASPRYKQGAAYAVAASSVVLAAVAAWKLEPAKSEGLDLAAAETQVAVTPALLPVVLAEYKLRRAALEFIVVGY